MLYNQQTKYNVLCLGDCGYVIEMELIRQSFPVGYIVHCNQNKSADSVASTRQRTDEGDGVYHTSSLIRL